MSAPRGAGSPSSRRILLLALVGLALFARGFFPVKPLLDGFSAPRTYASHAHEAAQVEDAPFSRLAFVVVDALRSDFLLAPDSPMTFAASLVSSGHALPYTAIAQAPTVTLPRLKALTTGSNPTFVDAMLNIGEESLTEAAFEGVDSWVRQMALGEEGKKRKIVFAGDDTWLRLFPRSWFAWSEGVTSFFVSDTVTVDTNVTRHLDPLLSFSSSSDSSASLPSDWDTLVLHYLGLDHVGHLGGPNSPLMPPKQKEMDGVIQRLYEYIAARDEEDGKRSLLVVVGDHGMTEGGNHGGSTEAETSAALLLAAPSLYLPSPVARIEHSSPYRHFEVVQQIDLVPTLSVLFDLGIPRNSMGKLIVSAVKALRPRAFANGLQANVEQMSAVLDAAGVGETDKLLVEASEGAGTGEGTEAVLLKFLSLAQSRLLATSSSYHLLPLYLGLALLLLSSIGAVTSLWRFWALERTGTRCFVGAAMLVFLGSLWATSFIEEEHEGWYFCTATGLVLLAVRPSLSRLDRFLLVFTSGSVRLMRAWAHNGQKNLPNLSLSSLLSTTYSFQLPTLLLLSHALPVLFLLYTLARASRLFSRSTSTPGALFRQALLFAFLATLGVAQTVLGLAVQHFTLGLGPEEGGLLRALEKLEVRDKTTVARAGFAVAGVTWGLCRAVKARTADPKLKDSYSNLLYLHLLLALLPLTRPSNVPLVALVAPIQHLTLHRLARNGALSPLGVAAFTAGMQACGFFGLGGSNSLASVDLSNSYTGLTSYSLPLVALLTYTSNFSLPILSSLSLQSLLSSAPPASRRLIRAYLTALHVLALAGLCASAAWFREHLFALTVFAPAVVVRATWVLWVQVGTNLGLARVLVG